MRVTIIGMGSISFKHIFALRKLQPEIEISALRYSTPSNNVDGVTNIYNIEDINSPDFVIISNPTNLHYRAILHFAKLKVPMLIEKPAIHSLENSSYLLDIINQNNVFTYVACNLRFHPCLKFLKNYISSNYEVINELSIYCGSYLPDWRPGKDFKTLYSANPEMGGGVHLDLFHEIDYTHWIFGQPLKTHSIKSSRSDLGIKAFDYANYILEYPGYIANITLNYYRPVPKRTIEIVFSKSIWLVDLIANKITDEKGTIIYEVIDYNLINTYIDQMRYFLDSMVNKITPMNTFSESLTILKSVLNDEI